MTASKRAKRAARIIVRTQTKFQTPKEGGDYVHNLTKKGTQPRLRKQAAAQVRSELGAAAAKRYRKAERTLDRTTSRNPVARTASRTAARKTQRKLSK